LVTTALRWRPGLLPARQSLPPGLRARWGTRNNSLAGGWAKALCCYEQRRLIVGKEQCNLMILPWLSDLHTFKTANTNFVMVCQTEKVEAAFVIWLSV